MDKVPDTTTRNHLRGWRNGSVSKGSVCSFQRTWFDSQHPHGGSLTLSNSDSREFDTFF
ncbi:hypothetical protein LEMLEM_LOCUS14952 [Lemmus lemmus]